MGTISLIFVALGFISCFVQAQPQVTAPGGIDVIAVVCKEDAQCSYNVYASVGHTNSTKQTIAWTSCDAATTPDGAYSLKKGTTEGTILMRSSSCGGGAFETIGVPQYLKSRNCETYWGTLCNSASK